MLYGHPRAGSLFSPAMLMPGKRYSCPQKLKSQPTAATRRPPPDPVPPKAKRAYPATRPRSGSIPPATSFAPRKNLSTRPSARTSSSNSHRKAPWKPLSPRKSSMPPGGFAAAPKPNPPSQHISTPKPVSIRCSTRPPPPPGIQSTAPELRPFATSSAPLPNCAASRPNARLEATTDLNTRVSSQTSAGTLLPNNPTKQTQSEAPQTVVDPPRRTLPLRFRSEIQTLLRHERPGGAFTGGLTSRLPRALSCPRPGDLA